MGRCNKGSRVTKGVREGWSRDMSRGMWGNSRFWGVLIEW